MNWHRKLLREEFMKFLAQMAALAVTALLLATGSAFAASVTNLTFSGGCPHPENDPTCDNSGNADIENVAILLGKSQSDVTLIGENSLDESSSAFSITFDNGNDFEVGDVSGTWSVDVDSSIDYLAFKANGYYILAKVIGLSGTWSTDINDWDPTYTDLTCPADICAAAGRNYELGDFLNGEGEVANLSHVSAYNVVPIPAAVWLFGSGLGMLGWMRRKSTAAS
jgi:hypothetical protein